MEEFSLLKVLSSMDVFQVIPMYKWYQFVQRITNVKRIN